MIQIKTNKTKKIDLSNFFNGEEAFVIIKYIQRDIWKHINRLTIKSADTFLYDKLSNDKEYQNKQKELEKTKNTEKKKELEQEMNKFIEKKAIEIYNSIEQEDLRKMKEIEIERNKLLFEYGIDKENHTFVDENNNKIILDYDTNTKIKWGFDFITLLTKEILNFNSDFDLGE